MNSDRNLYMMYIYIHLIVFNQIIIFYIIHISDGWHINFVALLVVGPEAILLRFWKSWTGSNSNFDFESNFKSLVK
jgi:c-di-AMP phosphodiesterase-like protein